VFSHQLNWVFYVTLAYGVVMISLAAYVVMLIIQEKKISDNNTNEQD